MEAGPVMTDIGDLFAGLTLNGSAGDDTDGDESMLKLDSDHPAIPLLQRVIKELRRDEPKQARKWAIDALNDVGAEVDRWQARYEMLEDAIDVLLEEAGMAPETEGRGPRQEPVHTSQSPGFAEPTPRRMARQVPPSSGDVGAIIGGPQTMPDLVERLSTTFGK